MAFIHDCVSNYLLLKMSEIKILFHSNFQRVKNVNYINAEIKMRKSKFNIVKTIELRITAYKFTNMLKF